MNILGYVFLFLIVFVIGCIRGESMEKERAEKLLNSDKPVYTLNDGTKVYVSTSMPTKGGIQ